MAGCLAGCLAGCGRPAVRCVPTRCVPALRLGAGAALRCTFCVPDRWVPARWALQGAKEVGVHS